MYSIREFLWTKETYPIKDMGNFLPNIVGYLHDDDLVRPTMLVVPGGGYFVVSTTEAQIVADKFFAAGYQTFVLTYTVNCGDMRNFPEICAEAGMSDIRYAQRLFKKYFGVSMHRCRQQDFGISLYHRNPWEEDMLDHDIFNDDTADESV